MTKRKAMELAERRRDKRVRLIYTKLIERKHMSFIDAYDKAHYRVYHK